MIVPRKSNRSAGIVLFFLVCSYTQIAISQDNRNNIVETNPFSTPERLTSIEYTDVLKTRAEKWGLKLEEYQHYLELMQGPLGKWNPNIDPLLALGMFATSPQQERAYAERYAQQEFELTQRAIHFQQTYRAAFNRLYPNISVLDAGRLQPYFQHRAAKLNSGSTPSLLENRQFRNDDRIMYFAQKNCGQCRQVLNKLVQLLMGLDNSTVDVYVINAKENKDVQIWASAAGVNIQQLKEKRITLNKDDGLQARLGQRAHSGKTTTQFYLRRNNQIFQLEADELGL